MLFIERNVEAINHRAPRAFIGIYFVVWLVFRVQLCFKFPIVHIPLNVAVPGLENIIVRHAVRGGSLRVRIEPDAPRNVFYLFLPLHVRGFPATFAIVFVPAVLFAVFRYIYLVLENAKGESPFNLLVRDIPILIDILGYVLVTFAVMYLL